MEVVYFCIICGREFRPAGPDIVICSSCGGLPEAQAVEQRGTTASNCPTSPQVTIPDAKARPQETVGVDAAGELRFCIVCGREFYVVGLDADKCHACGGPAETTEHPLDKIDLDKPQVTLTDDRPATSQHTIAVQPESISPPPGTSAVSTRTFAAETDVPDEWQIGDTILDLYEVKHIFTTGGMGLVYRVHHLKWNLDLAVKSPRAHLFQTEAQKQMFIGEAEAWIELGLHPHIVTCYYVRTLGGIPRVFAEFVEGGSLKDWIRDRRLYAGGEREALRRILDVAIQFAWGLGYAHEKGMVHQDVKPANALMTPDGTLKVTDFGLVKSKGYTALYAAPEQILGKDVDARTDIWCWGVSVLEMFIGECTWRDADGSIAAYVLDQYLSALPADLPRMPQGVAELLRDCFQNDLNLRPPSMDAVAERLMAVYQQEFGEPYPRKKPNPLDLRADSLNNRAVSYLDLGREDRAVQCWQEALEEDPAHLEANFNYGYYRWHRAELPGSEYLKQMRQLESTHGQDAEYWRLLGWIYLEQGYVEEVEEILQTRGVQDEALERAHRGPNRPVIREVRRMEGRTKAVLSVTFSPDGRYALSGSDDKTVRLWDLTTGREVRRMKGHTGNVISVVFSSDGRYALSGSWDATVRLWDLATGRQVRQMKGHTWEGVHSVVISPDGCYALSAGGDATVRLWDLVTGQEVRRMEGHIRAASSVAFSPDGRFGLSGGDSTVRLWDLSLGWEVKRMKKHTDWVRSVAFSPDGRYALSGSNDKTVRLWEIATGEEVWRMEGHTEVVKSVAFSPDGRYALSGSEDTTVRLWDLATGREVRRMEGHTSFINSVAFSPDGRYALSGSWDRTMRLWEICHIGLCRAPYPLPSHARTAGEEQTRHCQVAALQAEARKATSQVDWKQAHTALRRAQALPGYGQDVEILRMLTEAGLHGGKRCRLRAVWPVRRMEGYTDWVRSVAFSPDGRYALSGSNDKTVRLWEIAMGEEVWRMEGHTEVVKSVAFSPDGRYALSGSEDTTVRLWDLATGQEVRRMKGHAGEMESVAFSPDGRYVLSGGGFTVQLWDLATGQEVRRMKKHADRVTSVAFSPDGRYALSGSGDGTVRLWDLVTGRDVRKMERYTWVRSVAFSPDGRYALSGNGSTFSRDYVVRLWNVVTRQEVRRMEGHTSDVTSVAFSPDGRFALSGSGNEEVGRDYTVRLWDVATGREVQRMEGHTADVNAVAFSPDGRYALSGSADKTIRLWEFDWEWEFPDPADWDEGARLYLDIFLTLHTPYGPDGLSRVGAPQWTEEDFQKLLKELGVRGYGWLRPEGVRRELEKMAHQRGWKGR